MGFKDPIFEGNFDPRLGWTNVTTTSTSSGPGAAWQPKLYLPRDFYVEYDEFEDLREQLRIQEQPRLQGSPEMLAASTETAVAVLPEVIWDANGYYRAFGYEFPYLGITIKQMRLRYMEIDGQNSEWLTYILKTLRNPQQRLIYDCTPFWARYMDKYMQDWFKKLAMEQAKKYNQTKPFWADEKTPEDMLDQMGLAVEHDGEENESESLALPDGKKNDQPWRYAYFLWRSSCDDTDRLALWQELLRVEFVRAGVKLRYAVGFVGHNPRRWVSGEVQGEQVFFLNDKFTPTEEMAFACVNSYVDDNAVKEIENE